MDEWAVVIFFNPVVLKLLFWEVEFKSLGVRYFYFLALAAIWSRFTEKAFSKLLTPYIKDVFGIPIGIVAYVGLILLSVFIFLIVKRFSEGKEAARS